jgi:membrane-bound serine protease (ClpP class)
MIWAWVVAMMIPGMVLLAAEIAVIPGFGLAGVSALLLLIGGGGLAWHEYGALWGVLSWLLAGGAAVAVLRIAPKTRVGRSLVLETAITAQHPGAELSSLAHLVGQVGQAATALRPAGAATIGGRRIDVVTEGEFIPVGTAIKVVQVEGARVVVGRDEAAPPVIPGAGAAV